MSIVGYGNDPCTGKAIDVGFAYHREEGCLDIGGLTRPRPWWMDGSKAGNGDGATANFRDWVDRTQFP